MCKETDSVLKTILDSKLIAISRALYGDSLVSASLALYRGGVRAFEAAIVQTEPIEVSLACIRLLKEKLPEDAVIGAGTVMTDAQAEAARNAGAAFAISPNTNESVIKAAKSLGMVSIPGALTPTEIAAAYEYGADIVKVFPAGTMGVEYFKQIKAPLAHIPLAAVGGIGFENAALFAKAGASAFGISSTLYNKSLIAKGDLDSIQRAALDYCSLIK